MSQDTYEWDADKSAANLRNHGVAFAEAIKRSEIRWLLGGSMIAKTTARNG
jgi:uncharacterized DUF497 family protein